jgi:hypothetical protein
MTEDQKRQFLQETNFEDSELIEETTESKKTARILNKYPQWNQPIPKNN